MSSDHRITIAPAAAIVSVHVGPIELARSRSALVLQETGYAPVYYLPRGDIVMSTLSPSQHTSHCPFKGDASYFSLVAEAQTIANIAWSYEQPLDSVADITAQLAFYADKCKISVGGQ